ncbi:ATP-dependent nuclease [Halobacillus aidingensis]|uniref:Predicted ATP-dependent endonuclease of the OLD family, contains P-loop ATPase and TOPRIM domains n=1 Tax=Halobacillus aidingensis TaxID=240303 RepID=A0A1H0S996_HALAD|nr:AAA family ATPase [Halobacillus aidingensis]SDP38343.1 Predicted ATP-dependent endonuclease of the OLD family, contains P-loop ATPase and TOPRIM domains [Halobacillus aidingensis]
MRIKEFTVKNFKNIGITQPCKIIFPENSNFITIIGENNIGKSSILQALKLFLPETDIPNIPSLELFPNKEEPCNEEECMEISLTLGDFNIPDRDNSYIKPYIFDEEIKLKRIWSSPLEKDNEVPFKVFIPNRFVNELDMEATWNSRAFDGVSQELITQRDNFCEEYNISGTIPKAKKNEFVNYLLMNAPSLIQEGEPEWMDNPNGFASKLRSVLPKVVYVPAVKLIDDEADANKSKSAANQITSALFEHHLSQTQEIQNFKSALESLKNVFKDDTRHEEVANLEDSLSSKLRRIMDVEVNVDFDVPEVMEKLHLNSNILLKYNDLITDPKQQGHGVQRLLILSLLELMAEQLTEHPLVEREETSEWKRSFLFLIEEPEIYLHPHYQRKMRDSLVQIARHPLAQVACTSHSENFIDLADRHQGTVLLKCDNSTDPEVLQVNENIYSGENAEERRNRMRMLLNFNTTTLEAFFAKRVVLVEGDCEAASIHAITEVLKGIKPAIAAQLDSAVKEVTVIPCNGKLTQKAYYEVLTYFGVQPYLIHDLDGEDAEEGTNLNILRTIQHENIRLTHDPNFEEHIFLEKWESDKPWRATKKINNNFNEFKDGLLRFYSFILGEEKMTELEIYESVN